MHILIILFFLSCLIFAFSFFCWDFRSSNSFIDVVWGTVQFTSTQDEPRNAVVTAPHSADSGTASFLSRGTFKPSFKTRRLSTRVHAWLTGLSTVLLFFLSPASLE
ncbi:hypothetical protein BKA64DRAFT_145490 [Cadophora sp. MPI-SDFR-AT-0126]|nr:hypothetical protein BKA64DRAFT_145490 [Leotiomycetes sp. MPI-SDFR-AT-0126]